MGSPGIPKGGWTASQTSGSQKVVGPRDPKLVTLLTMVGKKIVPDKEGVGILAPLRFLWLLGPGWFQPEKYARSSNLDHETRVIDRVKKNQFGDQHPNDSLHEKLSFWLYIGLWPKYFLGCSLQWILLGVEREKIKKDYVVDLFMT